MQFAGQNHFLTLKPLFCLFRPTCNKAQKNNKKHCALLSFFFLFSISDGKKQNTCFNTETNGFNQRTACGAPVRWSKYTTNTPSPQHPPTPHLAQGLTLKKKAKGVTLEWINFPP